MTARPKNSGGEPETLDDACLRALGHPHDYAIRQELLSALEWDESLRLDHAGLLCDQFNKVHDHSGDPPSSVRSGADNPATAVDSIHHGIQSVRRSLATLVQVLAGRRGGPRAD